MTKRTRFANQIAVSGFIVVVLAATGFALLKFDKGETPPAAASADANNVAVTDQGKKLAEIETAPVAKSAITHDLRVTGQIQFPPDDTVHISPRLQGRVERVLVKVGDHVKSGDTLAVLSSVDAMSARTTTLQSENRLRLAKQNLDRQERLFRLGTPDVTAAIAALDQAKLATRSSKEALDRTKYQAKIGGFTEKPLEDAENALIAAKSALTQAKADQILAEKDYARKKKLFEIGVASKSDLETSENALEKAKANVSAGEDTVRLANQALSREQKASQSNLYADNQVKQAESAYQQAVLQEQAADKALRLARANIQRDLEQAQSDYKSAKLDDDNSHRALALLGRPGQNGELPIISPISGVITERNVNPGQVVDQSQMTPWQMFTVSNSSNVWATLDIYEKDIQSVTVGSDISIHVAAAPNREFSGKVLRIAPNIDAKSRTVKVVAEIPNKDGALKDGEFAEMTVRLAGDRMAITVPTSAVVHDGDVDEVFVFDGKIYHKRVVKLGQQTSEHCEIVSGLREGERIVTHGALYLGSQGDGG